ncbi:hypothetical protein [Cesiribacter andamanensis]|uniref:Uncharacterized protein n=1 Tax=Cesiribacter andamanensis AMV16 TaxID=1279009 RepID=M7N261_9BACT|nr:hypothetical protein [Cesiribacter andamanensis]EMR01402.1 hypothetical protein ADICEAN_03462 [Cesiribacter andamanensis AMV16]
MEKRTRKGAYLLLTLFFLLIAWATSIEEPQEIRSLPLSAQVQEEHIWLLNEAPDPLDGLGLVLNGVYGIADYRLAPGAEARIPLADFKDRNGMALPPAERPHVLEVYQNSGGPFGTGGYSRFQFD